jgi:hypothetical protein
VSKTTLINTYGWIPNTNPGFQVTEFFDGTEYVKTSTMITLQDIPWINLTITPTITLTSLTMVFVKPSGTGISNPATMLEKGGYNSMSGYQIDLSSDGGTTWTMMLNSTATTFPIQYTATVPSTYYTYGTTYKYKLYAWNPCGSGKYPYIYTFTTLTTTP